MKKRLLAFILAFIMVFGVSPLNGLSELDLSGLHLPAINLHLPKNILPDFSKLFATYAKAADPTSGTLEIGLTWSFSGDTLTISGNGYMADVDTNSSSAIPWKNFKSSIKRIVINNGVLNIANNIFADCKELTSVSIPSSVGYIKKYAFYGCSKLESVNIPNSVGGIDAYAFGDCSSLTRLYISKNVATLVDSAFVGCDNLESINVAGDNKYYQSAGNCIIEKETQELIIGCKNSVIPDDGSVISIGSYAFQRCKGLSSITIPDSVTSIGASAFSYCTGLTSVTIGNSVTSIGQDAFYNCTGLTSITIPDSVTSIGNYAFRGCTELTEINYNAANAANLTSSSNVFYNAGTSGEGIEVTFGDSVKKIPSYLFRVSESGYRPKIKSISFGNNVANFGEHAFEYCTGLASVTIPDGITSIGTNAFSNFTGLTSVTIGNSVTSIGQDAFSYCTGLTSVTIPRSVTSIGNSAFTGCTGLENVYYTGTPAEWCNISFGNSASNPICFANQLIISDTIVTEINSSDLQGTTSIGSYAFCGYDRLTDLTIADSVQNIGLSAFWGCHGLTSVTIGNGVTSIGAYAFQDCTGLKTLMIGNKVNSIGKKAFYNCPLEYVNMGNKMNEIPTELINKDSLKEFIIGNSVTSIGDSAFQDCTGLTSVTIGDSVTSIGNYAFTGCTGLTEINYNAANVNDIGSRVFYNAGTSGEGIEVTFGDSVETIPASLFSGSAIKTITISNSVTSIGNSAFYNCTGLTSVTIGNSVTIIGDTAFYNCTGLTSITIPDSVTSIGNYAFSSCTGLTSVSIGNRVTNIGTRAFVGCTGLTEINYNAANAADLTSSSNVFYNAGTSGEGIGVTFGDSVEKIPAYLFYVSDSSYRPNVKSVTIGNRVTSIGNYAFYNCTGLSRVDITNLKSWCEIGFENSFANPLYYARKLYLNNELVTDIEIPDGITTINNSAFSNYTELTSVTIGNSVTSIGQNAFSGCTGLTSITIPDSVTSISYSAFNGCTGLTSVTIPDNVTSIGSSAFGGCTGLTEINYNATNVNDIGSRVFYNAGTSGEGIEVTFGDSVEKIPAYLFYVSDSSYSPNIKSVTIGTCVASIGNSAFSGCTGITDVYYYGTAIKWNAVTIGSNNSSLTNAIRHYYIEVPEQLSTCTVTGVSAHSYWSDTNPVEYVIEPEIIERTEHTPDEPITENTVAATCTEDGSYDSVVYCSVCGEELDRETITVNATGHTPAAAVIENYVKSTCTENGSYDSVVYCSVCGEELSRETVTVPATGHTPAAAVIENYVKSTCTENGSYDSVVYCSVCGDELSRETFTENASGHSFTNYVSDNNATCLADGTKTAKCDNCEETDTIADEGSALGHALIHHTGKPSTCKEKGYADYDTCSRCDYTTYSELPLADHTPAAAVTENEVKATCTEDGSYDSVIYCSVCEEELSREKQIEKALGHNIIHHTGKPSTCKEKGYADYDTCSRCDYTTYSELPLAEHTPAPAVKENTVAATCTENGSYDSVVYCSVCGKELSRKTETTAKTGHKDKNNDGVCDICGTVTDTAKHNAYLLGKAKINVKSSATVDYRSTVTVTATASGLPEGYMLALYEGSSLKAKGSATSVSYNAGELMGNKIFTVKVVNFGNTPQKDSSGKEVNKTVEVKVKSGFFDKLIAFFRNLFGSLPKVEIKP